VNNFLSIAFRKPAQKNSAAIGRVSSVKHSTQFDPPASPAISQNCPYTAFVWPLAVFTHPASIALRCCPFLPRFCLFIKARHTGGGLIYWHPLLMCPSCASHLTRTLTVLFSRSLENGRLGKGEPLPVSAGRGFFVSCNPSILIAAADAPSKISL